MDPPADDRWWGGIFCNINPRAAFNRDQNTAIQGMLRNDPARPNYVSTSGKEPKVWLELMEPRIAFYTWRYEAYVERNGAQWPGTHNILIFMPPRK